MQNQVQEKGCWLTPDDLLKVQALLSDHALALAAGITLVADRNIQIWALNNWLSQQRLWGIWRGHDLIGLISAFPFNEKQTELGYLLRQNEWHKGIMGRAVAAFLKANPDNHWVARVEPQNVASQRILVKCGFQQIAKSATWLEYQRGSERDPFTCIKNRSPL